MEQATLKKLEWEKLGPQYGPFLRPLMTTSVAEKEAIIKTIIETGEYRYTHNGELVIITTEYLRL